MDYVFSFVRDTGKKKTSRERKAGHYFTTIRSVSGP
jgi:hypothetical protein